jgi:anti-anti-sigma factor
MTLTEVAQPRVPPATLVASVSAEGAAVVVALRVEADLFTRPVVVDLLARVIADSDGPVIVDLGHVEFIDTGTVRTLARAGRFLNDRGRTLRLRSPSRLATRVIGLASLLHLIEPGQRMTAA